MDAAGWVGFILNGIWELVRLLLAPTTLIAAMTAYIAYRQHRVDKLRYRHEVFSERREIYDECFSYLASIMRNGHAEDVDERAFMRAIESAEFLFSPEISEFMEETRRLALRLNELESYIREPGGGRDENRRAKAIEERYQVVFPELGKRFETLSKKFAAEMSLSSKF